MKIERTICDRCRKEFNYDTVRKVKYGVDIIRLDEWNEREVDLCQECIDDLQRWFYIKPLFKTTRIEYSLGRREFEYVLEVNEDDD